MGLQVSRGIRVQTAAENHLRTDPPAIGGDLPPVGTAEGMPASRRASDARPCTHGLNIGDNRADPSSPKLTRPGSNATSHRAESDKPLCTSRRRESVSQSAHGTMWEARRSVTSVMPVKEQQSVQYFRAVAVRIGAPLLGQDSGLGRAVLQIHCFGGAREV